MATYPAQLLALAARGLPVGYAPFRVTPPPLTHGRNLSAGCAIMG